MARRRAIDPTVEIKAYLRPDLAAKVQLLTFSPLTGKAKHGSISALVNTALEFYFSQGAHNAESRIDIPAGNPPPEGSDE